MLTVVTIIMTAIPAARSFADKSPLSMFLSLLPFFRSGLCLSPVWDDRMFRETAFRLPACNQGSPYQVEQQLGTGQSFTHRAVNVWLQVVNIWSQKVKSR